MVSIRCTSHCPTPSTHSQKLRASSKLAPMLARSMTIHCLNALLLNLMTPRFALLYRTAHLRSKHPSKPELAGGTSGQQLSPCPCVHTLSH